LDLKKIKFVITISPLLLTFTANSKNKIFIILLVEYFGIAGFVTTIFIRATRGEALFLHKGWWEKCLNS